MYMKAAASSEGWVGVSTGGDGPSLIWDGCKVDQVHEKWTFSGSATLTRTMVSNKSHFYWFAGHSVAPQWSWISHATNDLNSYGYTQTFDEALTVEAHVQFSFVMETGSDGCTGYSNRITVQNLSFDIAADATYDEETPDHLQSLAEQHCVQTGSCTGSYGGSVGQASASLPDGSSWSCGGTHWGTESCQGQANVYANAPAAYSSVRTWTTYSGETGSDTYARFDLSASYSATDITVQLPNGSSVSIGISASISANNTGGVSLGISTGAPAAGPTVGVWASSSSGAGWCDCVHTLTAEEDQVWAGWDICDCTFYSTPNGGGGYGRYTDNRGNSSNFNGNIYALPRADGATGRYYQYTGLDWSTDYTPDPNYTASSSEMVYVAPVFPTDVQPVDSDIKGGDHERYNKTDTVTGSGSLSVTYEKDPD